MALGIFFATSLDVNRVYWFGPLMYPFLTAFMNVVGEGKPSEACTNCTYSPSVCLLFCRVPPNAEGTCGASASTVIIGCWI